MQCGRHCEGGYKVGCEIAGAGGASLDDMIMNSIGVPGASAGADNLLPQSGVKLQASPTPSLPILSYEHIGAVSVRPAVLGRSVCHREALALPTSCAINVTEQQE